MISRDNWHQAFPMLQAQAAATAVCKCWSEKAASGDRKFIPTEYERKLTIRLCRYLRKVSPEWGVFGFWKAEPVDEDDDDRDDGGESRTDIEYLWGIDKNRMTLVFEFKKLNTSNRSAYKQGMERFVTGSYSVKEPMAIMVGILEDDRSKCVPALRKALSNPGWTRELHMVRPGTDALITPSTFIKEADFDTEHVRSESKAPKHGTILIAHLFVEWGVRYALPVRNKSRNNVREELEG